MTLCTSGLPFISLTLPVSLFRGSPPLLPFFPEILCSFLSPHSPLVIHPLSVSVTSSCCWWFPQQISSSDTLSEIYTHDLYSEIYTHSSRHQAILFPYHSFQMSTGHLHLVFIRGTSNSHIQNEIIFLLPSMCLFCLSSVTPLPRVNSLELDWLLLHFLGSPVSSDLKP